MDYTEVLFLRPRALISVLYFFSTKHKAQSNSHQRTKRFNMAETSRVTSLKINYKGEIHRIGVDLSSFKLESLHDLICRTFKLAPEDFVVQYKDGEGDKLNVVSDAEFEEACRVFLSGTNSINALKFTAVSRHQIMFHENVSDPILKAIERLVETLQCAVENVKKEEWAQRAQEGIDQTRGAVLNAAEGARDSLDAARQSFHEIPFEQVLKETTEGLKNVAQNIGSFAHDVVEEIKAMKISDPVQSDMNDQTTNQHEEVIEEGPQSSNESEWEDVVVSNVPVATPAAVEVATLSFDEQARIVANAIIGVEEAPLEFIKESVVAEPILSEEEKKWSEQLSLISDILPGVDTTRSITLLEHANGNVQVVLNALMEEL
uniref:Uncharacterized protein AlNc14C257G9750 n=1 Tax=Albugo laibachii Nc14 TaxID=890382 RepID=F0WTS5_9STRA|nr:conserved hypothetical protein [Albugo laibachii Nc14]|eukprot:CCA24768.1 conserved hypothetical protein [Albugo laibachii Nc14]